MSQITTKNPLFSSYSTLNKLSKTLIRSILRWTKLKHVNSAPFQLILTPNHSYFLPFLPKDLVINTPDKLRQSLCYFCRIFPAENLSTIEWNELINESFKLLRELNYQDQYLLPLYREHLFRKNEDLYDTNLGEKSIPPIEIKFRVGEVVENKLLGYRGVIINWTIERNTNLQLLTLLIDWYDFEQILHNSLPTKFYSTEFQHIRDKNFTRIHHNLISEYFLRYDAILGIYIPNYLVSYTHPHDSKYLKQFYSLELNNST